jgi:rhodanese-related sulfurtransferase
VDHIEHVGSHDSFRLSLDLCRNGIVCGPSSGFNLTGLYNFLERRKSEGTLKEISNSEGETHCVFLCCDLPYQYINEYFDKLGQGAFPPIRNEKLAKVDLHRYDESWELVPESALKALFTYEPLSPGSQMAQLTTHRITPQSDVTVIDLRRSINFAEGSLPGAINEPLMSVDVDSVSPFFDPEILEKVWLELEKVFNEARVADMVGRRALLLCYNGDCSRVATSVLRAKGVEASSIRGGMAAMSAVDAGSLPILADHNTQPAGAVHPEAKSPLIASNDGNLWG